MAGQPNAELTAEFTRLLRAADPDNADDERRREFAGLLAGFTENWAAGASNLDQQQESLGDWINSHPARPKAFKAGVGAGAAASRARRRAAKKR